MKKNKTVKAFLFILLIWFFVAFPIPYTHALETATVDQNGTTATTIRWQRKTFDAAGRYWQFWTNRTVGGYQGSLWYSSSADGKTWASPISIYTTMVYEYGEAGGVWFDENTGYIHATAKEGASLYYRRGTPNSDGSITWHTGWQNAWTLTIGGYVGDNYICVDSQGYPYLTWVNDTESILEDAYVTKSQLNNGTWQTASGYPLLLQADYPITEIVPLSNQQMYVLLVRYYMKGMLWNGTDWGPLEDLGSAARSIYTYGYEQWSISSVADSTDNIHVVFTQYVGASSQNVAYVKRVSSSGTWSNVIILEQSVPKSASPQITIDKAKNDLYVLWKDAPILNRIYLKAYRNEQWTSRVELLGDSLAKDPIMGEDGGLSAPYQGYRDKVWFSYVTSSTFNVKFCVASMDVDVFPVQAVQVAGNVINMGYMTFGLFAVFTVVLVAVLILGTVSKLREES